MILLVSGCNKSKTDVANNGISEYTAKKMQEENVDSYVDDDNNILENEIIENEEKNEITKENIITNNETKDNETMDNDTKEIKTSSEIDTKNTEEDNNFTDEITEDEIDTENVTYKIHQGIIDCKTTDQCLEISLPIQYDYQDIISNVYYHEVLSKEGKVLGYYIQYILKEIKFDNYQMCLSKIDILKNKIENKIDNYICQDDGSLLKNED